MKKTLAVLLIFALLLSLAGAACAEAEQNSTMYVYTEDGKTLNVRSDPYVTKTNVVGHLKYGATVRVREFLDGWCAIDFKWTDGTVGYVQSRFLHWTRPKASHEEDPVDKEKEELERKRHAELESQRDIDDPFSVIVNATRASGWINIRKGPSKVDPRVESCPDGTELEAFAETDNWYKVIDHTNGKTGYIYKTYVTVIPNPPKPETETDSQIGKLDVNGVFTLQGKLPPGYKLEIIMSQSSRLMAVLATEDDVRPRMRLTIAYNEMYSNVERMNDLSEAEIETLKASFSQVDKVEFSETETSHGTKLLVAREVGDEDDYVDFMSVYKGYSVEFVLTPNPKAEDQTLTDEQVSQCIRFLSDLDFIPAE